MRAPPQVRLLPDGRRLHLQDGPIDLVIEAFGSDDAVRKAYRAAAARFATVLDELCSELTLLRKPPRCDLLPLAGEGARRADEGSLPPLIPPTDPRPLPLSARERGAAASGLTGLIAQRMHAAVVPFAMATFITPMAAVAGAVAEEILGAMTAAADLDRAYVNNGGDIALHLGRQARFRIGMVDRPDRPGLFGHVELAASDPIRGIATSGCRGRSFSLGIADAVTVLARTAAEADAAATIIANAVDLPGHPGVLRAPATTLQPDSDLGERLVTRAVAPLTQREIATALDAGAACGKELAGRGLIFGAALHLSGISQVVGAIPGRRHSAVAALQHDTVECALPATTKPSIGTRGLLHA